MNKKMKWGVKSVERNCFALEYLFGCKHNLYTVLSGCKGWHSNLWMLENESTEKFLKTAVPLIATWAGSKSKSLVI